MEFRVEQLPLTEPTAAAIKLAEVMRERALADLTPEARAVVERIELEEQAGILGVPSTAP